MSITRRTFIELILPVAATLGIASSAAYAFYEPYREHTTRYRLKTPRWPQSYKPFNIAAVGDLHVGSIPVDLPRVDNIVRKLNDLQADIIVLLGDFLYKASTGGRYVPPTIVANALKPLKARYGVYAVLGNHDWVADGQGMWKALEDAGIHVLENNSLPITLENGQQVRIAGLADDTTRTPDLNAALAQCPKDVPTIMLSHDPATFLEMNDQPVVTLCGHTHGGQVAVPFVGAVVIPGRSPLRYAYGHIQENGRDMFVTSGIGTSTIPVRAFACPELMHVSIHPV